MSSYPTTIEATTKQPYIYVCAGQYGIVESIFSNLSATDTSSFIDALQIELSSRIVNKYVNIMRDMPEHMEWVRHQGAIGNRVMLIGADLERLERRVTQPQNYDRRNEKPLCIWLAVTPSPVARTKLANMHLMTWKGELMNLNGIEVLPGGESNLPVGPEGSMSRYMSGGGHVFRVENALASAFVCRFDHMRMLTNDREGNSWFISTIPNENNIKVVYFASYDLGNRGLAACLQPCTTMNTEAIACREMLTGERFDDEKYEWNVPLLKISHVEGKTISTLRYNLSEGGLENVIGTTDYPISVTDRLYDSVVLSSDTPVTMMRATMMSRAGGMESRMPYISHLNMPIENKEITNLSST